MNTPLRTQVLETAHNGYADWPVVVLRDARNIAIAEVGHIDRASAPQVHAYAALFAAAPALLDALKTLLGETEDSDYLTNAQQRTKAREAISAATRIPA